MACQFDSDPAHFKMMAVLVGAAIFYLYFYINVFKKQDTDENSFS